MQHERTMQARGVLALLASAVVAIPATAQPRPTCVCNSNIPAPTSHIQYDSQNNENGRHVECPTDTSDPNRDYAALMLFRGGNEYPLYEGSTDDPFDGTVVEFMKPDWEPEDEFFMRAICGANQYDSASVTILNRGRSTTPLPNEVRKAFQDLRKEYRKGLPRPQIGAFNPSTYSTLNISLSDWEAPEVGLPNGVELLSSRAALKRRGLGKGGLGGNPDFTSREITRTIGNRTVTPRVRSPLHFSVLDGGLTDVFGEDGDDKVTIGNHYQYYPEVYVTVEHNNVKYSTAIKGPRKVNVKVRSYEVVVDSEDDPE